MVDKSGKRNPEKRDLLKSSRLFSNSLHVVDGHFTSRVNKDRSIMDLEGSSASYHCGEQADYLLSEYHILPLKS